MTCGGQNTSWRSYCATCYQTQTIIKQMEETGRRSQSSLPTVNYGAYAGYSNSTPSRFSWLFENNFGLIGLWCWMFYMLWTVIHGANFTTMDFVTGLIFFIWLGAER
jgi:hypothetical protein